eukprot:7090763-Pyramimonas_sp.AAC.1
MVSTLLIGIETQVRCSASDQGSDLEQMLWIQQLRAFRRPIWHHRCHVPVCSFRLGRCEVDAVSSSCVDIALGRSSGWIY